MRMYVFGLGLAPLALLVLTGCRQVTGPTPTTPLTEVLQFDENYGAAAAGWRWSVGVVSTGAQEVTETTTNHGFAWIFYVVRGSTEIGTATGRQVLSAGQAAIVPARQDHTHRFLPQSEVLVFRPSCSPCGELHRAVRLYDSDVLPVTAGRNYRLRIREQTVSAWSPSTLTTDIGFAYVLEGPLVVRDGGADGIRQTGDAFGLLSRGLVLLTAGATPVRVAVVDLY